MWLVLETIPDTHYVRVVNVKDKVVGKFDQGIGPLEGKRMTKLTKLPQAAAEFFEGLSEPHHSLSLRLLAWCSEIAIAEGCRSEIVYGYTGMPSGYAGVPQLIFAEFHESGRAVANSRLFSIPLRCDYKYPLTIVFPSRFDTGRVDVDRSDEAFRPLSLDGFLSNPDAFWARK